MDNQNSDVSYNTSDQESQNFRPPRINNMLQLDVEANQTVDSLHQMFVQNNDDETYHDAANCFSKFYNSELIRKTKPNFQFTALPLFNKYKDMFKVYYPKTYLYFLPITILFDRKIERLIDLRDKIVDKLGSRGNVQIPKDRPQQIIVTLHDQKQMPSYILRSNSLLSKYKDKHKMPQLLDQNLSLNPLFEFYETNFEKSKFSQTCGIFMYWAYINRILSPDYLSESAIKIIVIVFFLISEGAPNIITLYVKQHKQQLEKLSTMYRTNKKMECQLSEELYSSFNFSLVEKRSFYQQTQRKYSSMTNILPIPYPVSKEDIKTYSDSYRSKQSKILQGRPHFAVIKFFKIMQYLENCIKRSQKIIFDVSTRKGVITATDIDFNIEVKHPIFGTNLCEKLSQDSSKIRILKQHVGNVASIYKRNKAKPLDAIIKIFEKS